MVIPFLVVGIIFLFSLVICSKRDAPVDVVLFIICIFTGLFYMLFNLENIYSSDGLWLVVGPVIVLIIGPLFFSMYYQHVLKEGI